MLLPARSFIVRTRSRSSCLEVHDVSLRSLSTTPGRFRGQVVSKPWALPGVKAMRGTNFPDLIHNWGRKPFLGVGAALTGGWYYALEAGTFDWWGFLALATYWGIGFRDWNSPSAILRNFPILGNLRYFCEMIRPEIQQYFIEDDQHGKPFSREERSSVYRRAKDQGDTMPFGTKKSVYDSGYEFVPHSLFPVKVSDEALRVTIGSKTCEEPYDCSRFNISAMSYGAISKNAVLALNKGAEAGGFYHNTGEGSVSPWHLQPGGDIVWNVGTGYFGCRTLEGDFCPEKFTAMATHPHIKMIEVKLSQGAKPGHGGILPADKLTEEIAEIRGVPMGKAVHSPPSHGVFSDPPELMQFLKRIRKLSNGKPVGFKLCVGHPQEVACLIRAAAEGDPLERPDFITVDGGEGGTGAAPAGFSNSIGYPGREGLALVVDLLRGAGIKDDVAVIYSGRVVDSFDLARALAVGADACASARGMMMALGCIQALQCHANTCPTGVATQDPKLYAGLNVEDKWRRVYYYQRSMLNDVREILQACGTQTPDDFKRAHLMRRLDQRSQVASLEELFPSVEIGALVRGEGQPRMQEMWDHAGAMIKQGRYNLCATSGSNLAPCVETQLGI